MRSVVAKVDFLFEKMYKVFKRPPYAELGVYV